MMPGKDRVLKVYPNAFCEGPTDFRMGYLILTDPLRRKVIAAPYSKESWAWQGAAMRLDARMDRMKEEP